MVSAFKINVGDKVYLKRKLYSDFVVWNDELDLLMGTVQNVYDSMVVKDYREGNTCRILHKIYENPDLWIPEDCLEREK